MAGFCGCAHGSRVQNVGTHVGSGVDSAHDDVRLFFEKHGKRELHAVRRRAVDAEAVEVVLIEGIGPQGFKNREGVPDARLLAHGSHHMYRVASGQKSVVQGPQADGAYTVVVGQQYIHTVFRRPVGSASSLCGPYARNIFSVRNRNGGSLRPSMELFKGAGVDIRCESGSIGSQIYPAPLPIRPASRGALARLSPGVFWLAGREQL